MALTRVTNSNLDLKIQAPTGDVPADDPDLQKLVRQLVAFNEVTPLKHFKFDKVGPPSSLEFDLEFEALDGRMWNQHIVFSAPPPTGTALNPAIAFDSQGSGWFLAEFLFQREIRLLATQIALEHGAVQITCMW